MQFYWEDNPIPATQESLKMTCRGAKFKTRTWIPKCVKIAVMIPPPHPPCGVGLKMIFFNLSINHTCSDTKKKLQGGGGAGKSGVFPPKKELELWSRAYSIE